MIEASWELKNLWLRTEKKAKVAKDMVWLFFGAVADLVIDVAIFILFTLVVLRDIYKEWRSR